jgi:hypothetical protein
MSRPRDFVCAASRIPTTPSALNTTFTSVGWTGFLGTLPVSALSLPLPVFAARPLDSADRTSRTEANNQVPPPLLRSAALASWPMARDCDLPSLLASPLKLVSVFSASCYLLLPSRCFVLDWLFRERHFCLVPPCSPVTALCSPKPTEQTACKSGKSCVFVYLPTPAKFTDQSAGLQYTLSQPCPSHSQLARSPLESCMCPSNKSSNSPNRFTGSLSYPLITLPLQGPPNHSSRSYNHSLNLSMAAVSRAPSQVRLLHRPPPSPLHSPSSSSMSSRVLFPRCRIPSRLLT